MVVSSDREDSIGDRSGAAFVIARCRMSARARPSCRGTTSRAHVVTAWPELRARPLPATLVFRPSSSSSMMLVATVLDRGRVVPGPGT